MGKSDTPETPEKNSSTYKIGDRTVANTYWNGNDYVTNYNPTSSETQVMNYLQAAMPQAYADALDNEGIASYADKWLQKQLKDYNEVADTNLTTLKDNLITGGQVGSSTGWNKIKSFLDSYNDTIADITANKDMQALNYQNQLLNYANNLQNAMNNYYNVANTFSQNSVNNQNTGWNQNVQDYQNQLAAYQAKNSSSDLLSSINTAANVVGTVGKLAVMTGL